MRNPRWTVLVAVLVVMGCSAQAAEKSPLSALFTEKLTDVNGKEVPLDALKGKLIGVYFSAHWCPPCRGFTPKLVKFRDANNEKFEVVFVSSDRSEADRKKYMKEAKMKWPGVKWSGKDAKALSKKYGVRGIPTLVILDAKGNIITKTGRDDVNSAPAAAMAKWTKAQK